MTTPLDKPFTFYIQYKIKVSDEKSSITEKFLTYDPLLLTVHNEKLIVQVSDVYDKFVKDKSAEELQDSPAIVITAKLVWQT